MLSTWTQRYGDAGFPQSPQSAASPAALQSRQMQHWGQWLRADPSCLQPCGCRPSLSLPGLVPHKAEGLCNMTMGRPWHVLVRGSHLPCGTGRLLEWLLCPTQPQPSLQGISPEGLAWTGAPAESPQKGPELHQPRRAQGEAATTRVLQPSQPSIMCCPGRVGRCRAAPAARARGRAASPHCPWLTPRHILLPVPAPCLDDAGRLWHVPGLSRPHPCACCCPRAQGHARRSPRVLPSAIPRIKPPPQIHDCSGAAGKQIVPGCGRHSMLPAARSLPPIPRCPFPAPRCPLPAAALPHRAGASPPAALSRAAAELETLATCFTGTSDISKIVFILAWNEDKYFRNFLDNIKFKISSKLK